MGTSHQLDELIEQAPAVVSASIEVDGVHLTVPIVREQDATAMRWVNFAAFALMAGSFGSIYLNDVAMAGMLFLSCVSVGATVMVGGGWAWARRARKKIVIGPRELRIGDRRWPLDQVEVAGVDPLSKEHELRLHLGDEVWILNGAVSGSQATDNDVVAWVGQLLEQAVQSAPLAREQPTQVPAELTALRGKQSEAD